MQALLPQNCASCISLTNSVGLQLSQGHHKGRLLFIGPHNSYHGDVVVYSDDGGSTYNWTMDLHQPGLDEGSIAELRNGSVMAIMRNNGDCNLPICCKNGECCDSGDYSCGDGNRFMYAVSTDGGRASAQSAVTQTWSRQSARRV